MGGEGNVVVVVDRWNPWRPHLRPELEPKTSFMPQHLLVETNPKSAGCQPVQIASMLLGYVRYHQWRRTPEELLIFLRTDFLIRYLDDEKVEEFVHWNQDEAVKEAEERPYLGFVCFEVLNEALFANPEVKLLPEVAEAARAYLRAHAEMLEDARSGAGLVNTLSRQFELRGMPPLLP
jgi:hypothetical protein